MKTLIKLCLLACLLSPAIAMAQVTQTARGINGNMDAHGRSPQLSVTRVTKDNGHIALRVDAFNPNREYDELYPMVFTFWVNRQHRATQFRSRDLSGPVGLEINPADTPFPFNYTVMVQTIHPNRVFSTIINGAVFSTDLIATLDCDLTLSAALAGEATTFSANNIETSQSGDSDLVLSFEGRNSDGELAQVNGVVSINANNQQASSTLRIVRNEVPQLIATTGTAELDEGSVAGLNLNSQDSNVSLTCN